ncbi:propionate catabolism operon regulatory protein PrpR [Janthinobacterium sp. 17J80-10]|uniref:propionate catabolism operon regulatory protein PrpR n=1 Tax=Janthinobacterium sp. 17J80-10 TaxID=2497863 RepID=UPI00100564F5|nr:propionate catabolism operon regulatory protein PrpR [Janthinobacterium sp. 17J80-10]QAU34141.1 propionate catabolism operon regulatory protein PrpR [Janthinobacterium sp. 17J80-10]
MANPLQQAQHSARIVILLSHLQMLSPPSRLALELQGVLPAFAGAADIRIIDLPISDTLQQAQELEREKKVDVFICTGATGAYLRKHLATPVVLMPLADYDILHALERARRVSDRVAILSYRNIHPKLEEVQTLFTVALQQAAYTTLQQAEEAVRQFASEGYEVIIGSSMVTELAEQAGMTGILVTSSSAARQALDDALVIFKSARAEAAKRQSLNTLLQHLTDGVLAVDMAGKVQTINPALAQLLGVSAEWAQLRPVAELDAHPDIEQVLRTGIAVENRILRLGTQTVLANIIPIYEDGEQTGAVLTCQDAGAVQRADRQLRSSTRQTRFVAKYRLAHIVGDSTPMKQLLALAERCAQTDATILIQGESGTGKELLAQGVHNASRRRKGPFVAVNCAAFPENLLESELFGYEEGAFTGSRKGGKPGLFEAAHTGTIFLDEIGDMPLPLQTRLLRVLQEREVVRLGSTEPTPIDVRIIAATHRNLRQSIAEGGFREDLYYRLNILRLKLPALRDRKEDIHAIASHILAQVQKRSGTAQMPQQVLQPLLPYLESYSWPGNIRELENVIERAVLSLDGRGDASADARQLRNILGDLFDEENIPITDDDGAGINLKSLAKTTELIRIRKVLDECGGNLEHTARRLGISRSTLWRRLNQPQQ